MAPEDIEALFRAETSHVEWKESHDAKDLLDAVCAFANDLADSRREGYVLVGVNARTGAPAGKYPEATTNTDEVQQKLVSLISSTKIIPHPVVAIETLCPIGHVLEHRRARARARGLVVADLVFRAGLARPRLRGPWSRVCAGRGAAGRPPAACVGSFTCACD